MRGLHILKMFSRELVPFVRIAGVDGFVGRATGARGDRTSVERVKLLFKDEVAFVRFAGADGVFGRAAGARVKH